MKVLALFSICIDLSCWSLLNTFSILNYKFIFLTELNGMLVETDCVLTFQNLELLY